MRPYISLIAPATVLFVVGKLVENVVPSTTLDAICDIGALIEEYTGGSEVSGEDTTNKSLSFSAKIVSNCEILIFAIYYSSSGLDDTIPSVSNE